MRNDLYDLVDANKDAIGLEQPKIRKQSTRLRNGRLLLVTGCIFLFVVVVGYQFLIPSETTITGRAAPDSALIQQINSALEANNIENAKRLLEKALANTSNDPETQQQLTELQVKIEEQAGENTLAAEANQNQTEQSTNLNDILAAANLAFAQNDWEQAIDHFERVRSLDERLFEATSLQNLAEAYLNAGLNITSSPVDSDDDLQLALRYFRNALDLNPQELTAMVESELLKTYLAGARALKIGTPRQATDFLLPLYRDHPEYLQGRVAQELFDSYIQLGDLAMRRGERNLAVNYFGRAAIVTNVDQRNLEERREALTKLPAPDPTPAPTTVAVNIAPQVDIAEPTATPAPTLEAPKCPDPHIELTHPRSEQVVAGNVQIKGTVFHEAFSYFKVEYMADGNTEYAYLAHGEMPVTNGWIGLLDVNAFAPGRYTIRVTVVDTTGNYPAPCDVTVIVEDPDTQ